MSCTYSDCYGHEKGKGCDNCNRLEGNMNFPDLYDPCVGYVSHMCGEGPISVAIFQSDIDDGYYIGPSMEMAPARFSVSIEDIRKEEYK